MSSSSTLHAGKPMRTVTITPSECRTLSMYIYELCGITLDQSKAYLFESRLRPLLEACQCRTYGELYTKARHDPLGHIPQQIIDAISTNETSFFRDSAPFDLLKRTLLPDWLEQVQQGNAGSPPRLNIWSAACSTGQEAYSIAMTLHESLRDLSRYRINILGTDISDAALAQASRGQYNKVEMARGLSPEHISRYFDAVGSAWRVKDELRVLVSFRKFNLLSPMAGLGIFDLIFCRNVAIYFRQADRLQLFQRLAAHLHPAGALVLGATEALPEVTARYVRRIAHKMAFYQRASTAGAVLKE